MNNEENVKTTCTRKIRLVCGLALALLCALDAALCLFVEGYYHATVSGLDKESYIFFPAFAFIVCIVAAFVSEKFVGLVLRRGDTYYDA